MSNGLMIYSFTHHLVMINGREMRNFGEGDDVVSVEYREDGIGDVVGADGQMLASVSANESAEIKLKFLGTAPENDYLEDLYRRFKSGEIAGISISIFNAVTGRGEVATTGYIPKLANSSRGQKAQDREWSIIVPSIDVQQSTRI